MAVNPITSNPDRPIQTGTVTNADAFSDILARSTTAGQPNLIAQATDETSEPLQAFTSSRWHGKEFVLYEKAGADGNWELRLRSLRPGERVVADVLVGRFSARVKPSDFGAGTSLAKQLGQAEAKLNATGNIRAVKTEGKPAGNLWDATVGAVTAIPFGLAGTVASIPEGLGRNTAALGGDFADIGERGLSALAGQKPPSGGFSNILREEQRQQFAEANVAYDSVNNARSGVSSAVGSNANSWAYQGGDVAANIGAVVLGSKAGETPTARESLPAREPIKLELNADGVYERPQPQGTEPQTVSRDGSLVNPAALVTTPVITDSPLTLSANGDTAQVIVRNFEQPSGGSQYTLNYSIGGQDYHFSLPGASNLVEASNQVQEAFKAGRLPGIVAPRVAQPEITDSPLTLQANGTSAQVVVRNVQQPGGGSQYTVNYSIAGKDYHFSLPGASTLAEASKQVEDAFNGGKLPGIVAPPEITDSPLTLQANGTSAQVVVRNVQQPGGGSKYTVNYSIGGKDYHFSLPGASNLAEASKQVEDAFNGGKLPGIASKPPTVVERNQAEFDAGNNARMLTVHPKGQQPVTLEIRDVKGVTYVRDPRDNSFHPFANKSTPEQFNQAVRKQFGESPQPQANDETKAPFTITSQSNVDVRSQANVPNIRNSARNNEPPSVWEQFRQTSPEQAEAVVQGVRHIFGANAGVTEAQRVVELMQRENLTVPQALERVSRGNSPQTQPSTTILGPDGKPVPSGNPRVEAGGQLPNLILPGQLGEDFTGLDIPAAQPMSANQLTNLVRTIRQLPANIADKARGPLLWIVSSGQIPSSWNDIHAHNGGFWGTYDPQFANRGLRNADDHVYMGRLTSMLGNGKSMQFYFPVAPQLSYDPPGFTGKTALGANTPGYYNAVTGLFRNNVIGRVELKGDVAQIVEPIRSAYGNIVINRMSIPRTDFETLIGRTIPRDVNEVQFVPTPVDCNLHYQGVEADRQSILKLGTQVRREVDLLGYSPTQRSHFVGLTGNNPLSADGYKSIYDGLAYANDTERTLNLPLGTLQVGNEGEITLDKEAVTYLSSGMPLLRHGEEEKANVDRFFSPMKYAGGLTIVHADIGQAVTRQLPNNTGNYQTFVLKSQYENFSRIKDVFQRNPDQQFIWAHAGASYTQQTDPTQHIRYLREVLQDCPNVKIDLSWTATNKEIFRDGPAWARLVADFPTRFIWGSDTIAASNSLDPEAIKGPMKALEKNGFLKQLDKIAPGIKERFLSQNFIDTLPAAQQRVNTWRSDPWVAQWLANGGYDNGTPPPKVWVKSGANWDNQSDWRLEWNQQAFQTNRPWWNEGQTLSPDTPPVTPRPTEPTAIEPYQPAQPPSPTTGQIATKALTQLLRPQGIFFGVSTRLGSGFAVIPRKAFTQFLNPRELNNLRRGGLEALTLPTIYASTPAIKTWDIGTTKVVVQAAGIANKGTQEAGVNVFVSQTLPGNGGKVGFFINIRQDWATAQPLVEKMVRQFQKKSEQGLNPLISEFGNGQIPESNTNSISANAGLMYGVSNPLIAAITATNPKLGAALKAAQQAAGGELWIGGGGRADLNFYNNNLVSMRIQDTMIPVDGLNNLLEGAKASQRAFIQGLQNNIGDIADAQQQQVIAGGSSTPLSLDPAITPREQRLVGSVVDSVLAGRAGTSPWVSARSKLDVNPITNEPLVQNGTVSFIPSVRPSENIAATVYSLAVKYRVIGSNETITPERAGAIVDGVLDATRNASTGDYQDALKQLTSNGYNLDFGSAQLRHYYGEPGNYNLGYIRGTPRDYEQVRRQFGQ